MQKRQAIDTFYTGLDCTKSESEDLVTKINNYLSFNNIQLINESESRCKNPYYTDAISNYILGYNIFWNPKFGVKNKPITIELNGHFFRYDTISRLFINALLQDFKEILSVQRLDVATDFIYKQGEKVPYKGKKLFSKYMPWAVYSAKNNNGVIPKHEGHFSLVDGKIVVDGFNIGRHETKLRVYDKNQDINDKDSGDTYLSIYGIPNSDIVYRVEYMQRGDTFKGVWKNGGKADSYEELYLLGLNQMLSRYTFYNCSFEGESTYNISSYLKREKPLIERQLDYAAGKVRSDYAKYLSLRKEYLDVLEKRGVKLNESDLCATDKRCIDFYKLMEDNNEN